MALSVLAVFLLCANLVSLLLFTWDKWQAGRGGWRLSERQLLRWSWLGPLGSWWALRRLRHKSSKVAFRRRWWWRCCLGCLWQAGALLGVWVLLS